MDITLDNYLKDFVQTTDFPSLDAMEYIIQDIREDFFDKFSTATAEDTYRIIYEFSRYRAKMNVIDLLFQEIKREFSKNNITAY